MGGGGRCSGKGLRRPFEGLGFGGREELLGRALRKALYLCSRKVDDNNIISLVGGMLSVISRAGVVRISSGEFPAFPEVIGRSLILCG